MIIEPIMVGKNGTRAKRRAAAVGTPCPYCHRKMSMVRGVAGRLQLRPTVDHVLAKVRGGPEANDNRILCCLRCNQDKGHLTLPEWHAELVRVGDLRAPVVAEFIAGFRDVDVAAADGWVGAAEALESREASPS